MWAFKRDPITGDRIPDGRGGWVKTQTCENLVRNQLLAKYGRCWQDAELGSLLSERDRFVESPAELIAEETRRAIGRVVRSGRASSLNVITKAARSGRVDGATSFIDSSTAQVVTTKIPTGG